MNTPIIKINNLYRSFEQGDETVNILKNINLEVESGDFVAIVGQSGSGKSTLMNILGCLDKPSAGTYEVYGTEISNLEPDNLAELRCNHFGFIFQRYQLISGITALENVEMPAIYYGMPSDERKKRATSLLTQLGLGERLDHTPGKLSGGQQQRVSIARALMNGGEVIFADEPTGALDSRSGKEVMQILHDLNRQGHTIIMVTHDPNLAQQAKRIIEIKDGEVINDERTASISDTDIAPISNKKKLIDINAILSALKENYKMAIRSITNNKLRAILTMLGIIFGIASVVSMVSIGNGTVTKIMSTLGEETARTMYIFKGREFNATNLQPPSKSFNESDLQYLKSLPYLKDVMPNVSSRGVMQYGNTSVNTNISGCDFNCISAKDLKLLEGRTFNKNLINNAALVTIIDEDSAKELFPHDSAVDKIVSIQNIPMKIIGVVEKKSSYGQRISGQAYMPYTTASVRFMGYNADYPGFSMIVKKGYSIPDIKEKVDQYFYAKHGNNRDFEIFALDDQIQKFNSSANGLKLFILIVASIALLVGGIGVMNIMLVSVTERTPEIGIRMAVGATQKDIKQQFLIESVILCLLGGLIGVLLAFLLGGIIKIIASNPDSMIGFTFSMTSVVIAVFFATLIGVIFGYIPAKNASQLDPVDALSRE
ncbi:MacB family efflux pump subunit [Neisseriaceae bacterium PsAf]|nr:MacB family efflux pump subunit [Neisseriaceae bacterium PsAf]MCV2503293.1 MacB family efflux pump subunit [Neisseriaceae bacterium]